MTASAGVQAVVTVKEGVGASRPHWPMAAGVPFARGALSPASGLAVSSETGTPAAAQSRVLSRWPDGTVRWAFVEWQADLQPGQVRRFRVAPGAASALPQSVIVQDRGDRVEVDTGPLQFAVPRSRFAWMERVRLDHGDILGGPIESFFKIGGTRLDGQPPTAVTITESGPLRVRIEMRGHYGPSAGFDYVVRIEAFAGQPFVRVFHTFEQHGAQAYTQVQQIAVHLPLSLRGKRWYRAGREQGSELAGRLGPGGFTLVQEDDHTLRVGASHRAGHAAGGHAAGWADVGDDQHGLAVVARFFWQQYPQGFSATGSDLTYDLWAADAAPAKVGMGAAKTHEMVLYFHGKTRPAPSTLAATAQPILGSVEPQWTVASGALRNSVAPDQTTKSFLRELAAGFRRYQASTATERWDDSGALRCPDPAHERPRQGFYGMLNWGDWNYPGYHDATKGCDAWGNLEYDLSQVLALAYAASGEQSYVEGTVAAARHFMDVDRIYYQREHPNWIGMNHPKNPLHFAFELGGVDLGHTWTEGLLSYYYLTGDERGLEAARGIADYLVNRLRAGVVRGNPRQWGWPQIALVAVYEATADDRYKQAAREYARGGMAVFAPDNLKDWKLGILAEALAYTHSVSGDAQIADWLSRHAAAVMARGGAADARFFPAVAYVGRLTSNPAYTSAAAAVVERLKFGDWGKPFTIAGRLGFSILSAAVPRAATPRAAASSR